MTDPRDRRPDDGAALRRLLRAAGPRPAVPEDRARRARAAARDAWRETVASRRRGGRLRSVVRRGLAAAAVVAAILVTWTLTREGDPPTGTTIADATEVLRVDGAATVAEASGTARSVTPGLRVEGPGTWSTGPTGRVALRLPSGHEVRLDRDTVLVRTENGGTRLERGAVYVDSGGAASEEDRGLRIETPFGAITETGTQYEIRLEPGTALHVRVREGAVRIDRDDGGDADVPAGRARSIAADGTDHETTIAPDDPAWSWTHALAEPFVLEGRTLAEFLEWAERERGARFRFEDPSGAEAAEAITLEGGSLAGFDTAEALTIVLTASGWSWTRDEASEVYVLRGA